MGRAVVREEEKREGQERGPGVKNGGLREEENEEKIPWQRACRLFRMAAKEAGKNSFEYTPVTQVWH